MKIFQRALGILVMIAGILGLVLSLAGLVGVWTFKPTVTASLESTVAILARSIDTSQQAMEVTGEALGATVESVEALSVMLGSTAATVEDTQPVFNQLNTFMGESLPSTMQSASDSLAAAQKAADVLDGAIRSLEKFRVILGSAPLIGGFVDPSAQPYDPEQSMADSLGELSVNLAALPDQFTEMAANLDKADDNLGTIQTSLETMSSSVGSISASLSEYQKMIAQSQSSMENVGAMLGAIQDNLAGILNMVAIVISLFLSWLLAAQIVILSQGWELYQGTAGRMEGGAAEPVALPDDTNAVAGDGEVAS